MDNKLHILWTNDNVLTAEHMLLMYAQNTLKKGLWDDVTIIIWGATSELVSQNTDIQKLIAQAQKDGVKFSACSACAANLGTTELLLGLGIELKMWGQALTELIKNKENLITI